MALSLPASLPMILDSSSGYRDCIAYWLSLWVIICNRTSGNIESPLSSPNSMASDCVGSCERARAPSPHFNQLFIAGVCYIEGISYMSALYNVRTNTISFYILLSIVLNEI